MEGGAPCRPPPAGLAPRPWTAAPGWGRLAALEAPILPVLALLVPISASAAPLVAEAADLVLTAPGDGRSFGQRVRFVGDTNGDGFDDLVVAGIGRSGDFQWWLVPGAAGGVGEPVPLLHDEACGWGHTGLAGPADVDGDGHGDVVVGCTDDSDPWIVYALTWRGGPAGVDGSAATSVVATSMAGGSHSSIGSAGDVDGDGDDEILVAQSSASSRSSRWVLLAGAPSGLQATPLSTGEHPADEAAGLYGRGVGDLDGDGHHDVALPWHRAAGGGLVRLHRGGSAGLEATAWDELALEGSTAFGVCVAGAHLDGDDVPDLVGVDGYAGWAAFLGDGSGFAVEPDLRFEDTTGGWGLEWEVSAGDLDGDGHDELAHSAPWYEDAEGGGAAHLFRGGPGGPTLDRTVVGPPGGAGAFGNDLDIGGDLDGDGADDLVVGAFGLADGRGEVHVWWGIPGDPDDTGGDSGTSDGGGTDGGGTDGGATDGGGTDGGGTDGGGTDGGGTDGGETDGGAADGGAADGGGTDKGGGCRTGSAPASLAGLGLAIGLARRRRRG